MVELLSGSNNLAGYQYNIMIVCIVHAIICSLILETVGICCSCGKDGSKYTYQIVWAAIKLIILGVSCYFLYKSIKVSKGYETTAIKIKNIECSDSFGNSLFDDYSDSQLGTKSFNVILAVLCAFSAVVTIASFIIGMIQKNR